MLGASNPLDGRIIHTRAGFQSLIFETCCDFKGGDASIVFSKTLNSPPGLETVFVLSAPAHAPIPLISANLAMGLAENPCANFSIPSTYTRKEGVASTDSTEWRSMPLEHPLHHRQFPPFRVAVRIYLGLKLGTRFPDVIVHGQEPLVILIALGATILPSP